MKIICSRGKNFASVSIEGKLDATCADEAGKSLEDICGNSPNLIVNLARLEYVSSAGMRVLLVTAKNVQQKGGKISLSNLSAKVREVFDISGFSSIFKIFDTVEDAEVYIRN